MRILIVDDSPVALSMLAATLTQAGYEVHQAANGKQALELIRHDQFRLVISDWEMPEMDGAELLRAVREDDLPGYVYLIILTARDTPSNAIEGLMAGADDFVSKPYNPAELLARVRAGERVLSLETREVAIFAMAKLAESRDPETGAHLERVQGYCRTLAQELSIDGRYRGQITAEYIRLIYLTSPLHDIGKVGIPDSVLLKPGRLSDREFEIMKTHTTLGAQTLEAALRMFPGVAFLEMARDIALGHHERFDGTGYPAGASGEAIPLCARIVAVADVYDALTSKRVYKAAFGHEVAKSMIAAESGTHFDPHVVSAFLRSEEQFLAIRERFGASSAEAA